MSFTWEKILGDKPYGKQREATPDKHTIYAITHEDGIDARFPVGFILLEVQKASRIFSAHQPFLL